MRAMQAWVGPERLSGCWDCGRLFMPRLITFIEIWVALNFAIPAFILYQRSPHFRHRLFRWTIGGLTPPRERQLAHALVGAARRHR
jgi:hypothetical protein